MNTQEFINRARFIFGDRYDYSKVVYTNAETKITIICRDHGEFSQTPHQHLKGANCKTCGKGWRRYNQESYVAKANQIHNNKYDYSKTIYKPGRTKLTFICPKHGEFEQLAEKHLKSGCKRCADDNMRKGTDLFIQEAHEMHNNVYDYSKVNYVNNYTHVIIICPKHGEFSQTPAIHLSGSGCTVCWNSKGEKLISEILDSEGIKYLREHRFPDCKHKNTLPYDFYLPDFDALIEFDGRQHEVACEFYGGEKALKQIQITDAIKNQYAKDTRRPLLRVKHDDKKIYDTVIGFLFSIH